LSTEGDLLLLSVPLTTQSERRSGHGSKEKVAEPAPADLAGNKILQP